MSLGFSTRAVTIAILSIAFIPCAGKAQGDYVTSTPKQLEKCLQTLKCGYPQDLRDATYNAIQGGQIKLVDAAYKKANEEQREEIVIGIQWSDKEPLLHQFDPLVRSFLQASRPGDLYEDGRWNALQYLATRCDKNALHTLMLGGATKDSESLMKFSISSLEWSSTLASFGKCGYKPARDVLTYSLDATSLNAGGAAYESLQKLFPGVCTNVQSPKDAETCYLTHWSEQEKFQNIRETKKD